MLSDNDGMIGNQNKLISKSRSIPKEQSLKQNRHVQIKEIPIHGKAGSPPIMRKREAPNTNSRLKQRNSSEPPHLGQKPCPRKVESSIRVWADETSFGLLFICWFSGFIIWKGLTGWFSCECVSCYGGL